MRKISIVGSALSLCIIAAASCQGGRLIDPCPQDMARVPGQKTCIDRFEASIKVIGGREFACSLRGVMPATKTSFIQAERACRNSKKRICTLREWLAACRGREGRTFPYGNLYDPHACNGVDDYPNPMDSRPKKTGSKPNCRTPDGVYDLSGNLWEWTGEKDLSGNLRLLQVVGFSNTVEYLACNAKESREAFQPIDRPYWGYGFRCCKDL